MQAKISVIAGALTLALTGCGGGGGGGNSGTPTPDTQTITVLDGYLYHADVFSGDNCTTALGKTNEQGQITVDTNLLGDQICAVATANVTVDMTRGIVSESFDLNAINSTFVTPFSDYVAHSIENGASKDDAIAELKAALGDIEVTTELLMGDYLGSNSSAAKALLVIGETLVDHDDTTAITKQTIIAGISDQIADDVLNNRFDPNNRPSVSVDQDGNVNVTAPSGNQAPQIVASVSEVQAIKDQPIDTVDLKTRFTDDNDAPLDLFYAMKVVGETDNMGLSVSGGVLSGQPNKSGSFVVEIKATDSEGLISNALFFDLVVSEPALNTPPSVDTNVASNLQSLLNGQAFYVNEAIDQQYAVTSLFTDADQDPITYALSNVKVSEGLNVSLSGETVTIGGTTTETGLQQFSLIADDGQDQSVAETFSFTTSEKPVNPAPSIDSFKSQLVTNWIAILNLKENTPIEDDISIKGLFIDTDLVSVEVTGNYTEYGYSVSLENNILTLSGSGTKAGTLNLTLTATDANSSQTRLELSAPVWAKPNTLPRTDLDTFVALQDITTKWKIEKGISTSYTLSLAGLFTDAEDDPLTLKAESDVVGLTFSIDDAQQLTVSGTASNSNATGHKTLVIKANDSEQGLDDERWVKAQFSFRLTEPYIPSTTLSDIDDIDAEPITDGRMMFSIAHYTEYDDGQIYMPPSYQCLGLRLIDGKYEFYMSSEGKTCPEDVTPDNFVQVKSYSVINDYLYAYPTNGSVSSTDEIFSIKMIDDTTGEIVLTQEFPMMTPVVIDTGVMFNTPAEANKKITLGETVTYQSYFPDPENKQYVPSEVTATKTGVGQATFTLSANSQFLTCDVLDLYDGFKIVIGDSVQEPASSTCRAEANKISIDLTYTETNGHNQAYFYNWAKHDPSVDKENPARYLETIGAVLPNQNM